MNKVTDDEIKNGVRIMSIEARYLYRMQTGKGIEEQFFEERGVPTYTMDRETGIMKNNRTDDIMKPKKVSYIQIVK